MVAGAAGGIPLQLQDGIGGYLVDSVEECAQRSLELLTDPELRRTLGEAGREHVRERFLLTRLIADELRLYASVLGVDMRDASGTFVALGTEDRDPVCGTRVDRRAARHLRFDHQDVYFCSSACEEQFARDPDRFLRAPLRRGAGGHACVGHTVTETDLAFVRLSRRTVPHSRGVPAGMTSSTRDS